MKLSKSAKARIRRMTSAEKKAIVKAAAMLADCEAISGVRYATIERTCNMMR